MIEVVVLGVERPFDSSLIPVTSSMLVRPASVFPMLSEFGMYLLFVRPEVQCLAIFGSKGRDPLMG